MFKFLAGAWALMILGTSVVYGVQVGVLDAIRVFFGSMLAFGSGRSIELALSPGAEHDEKPSAIGTLIFAGVPCLLSFLVLQSQLRLGPQLWLPSYVWIGASVIVGFFYARSET